MALTSARQHHPNQMWRGGCRNTAALWREFKNLGFAGQYTVVWTRGSVVLARARRRRLAGEPMETASRRTRAAILTPEPPTPRLLTAAPDSLSEDAGAPRSPDLGAAAKAAGR